MSDQNMHIEQMVESCRLQSLEMAFFHRSLVFVKADVCYEPATPV